MKGFIGHFSIPVLTFMHLPNVKSTPPPRKPCIRIDLAIQVGEESRRQAIWLENLIFLKFDI